MATYDLKALLEAKVVDPILAVMAKEDTKLRNQIAGLGTWIGSEATFAALPVKDQNGKDITIGDTATLTATDGDNVTGLYRYDGTVYQLEISYEGLDFDNILNTIKSEGGIETDKGVDDKFTSAKQVYDFTTATFHPKGGLETLKVLAENGDEGTKEVVNASQLALDFTEADFQTKYDALKG